MFYKRQLPASHFDNIIKYILTCRLDINILCFAVEQQEYCTTVGSRTTTILVVCMYSIVWVYNYSSSQDQQCCHIRLSSFAVQFVDRLVTEPIICYYSSVRLFVIHRSQRCCFHTGISDKTYAYFICCSARRASYSKNTQQDIVHSQDKCIR